MKRDFSTKPIELNVKLVPETHPVRVTHIDGIGQPRGSRDDRQIFDKLTPKEREVITWLIQGKSNREISQILNRSEATIKTHVHHIMVKLRTSSRTQTVALWASLVYAMQSAALEDKLHGRL